MTRTGNNSLNTLGEVCAKTGWQVHALCLMPNHFHLAVETPNANLVVGMKWFLGTYTARFNRRHKLFGHLFSGRYKSLIVDGSEKVSVPAIGEFGLTPLVVPFLLAGAQLRVRIRSDLPSRDRGAPGIFKKRCRSRAKVSSGFGKFELTLSALFQE